MLLKKACVFSLLVLFSLPALAQDGLVSPPSLSPKDIVSVQAEFTSPTKDKPGQLYVSATIRAGWHIYSITQPEGGPLPTKIELSLPPGVKISGDFKALNPPEAKKEPLFDNIIVEKHHGRVTWVAPLMFQSDIDPAAVKIEGFLQVQPCDANSCLSPAKIPFVATISKTVRTEPALSSQQIPSVPQEEKLTIFTQLVFAFLGGLILNVMPCVLPVISLKIVSFLNQAGESRGRVFMLNVWYTAGLMLVFMILAALAHLAHLAWGEQFTLPWFKMAMTALVFVMALSFLGVWQIPIPGFVGVGRASQLQAKEGPSGAFFKGVFATILATPCSGPFLGPVFGYLLKQPPQMAYLVFGAVGLGMASPYLLIGMFPKLIRFLPRPGEWMETVEQLMGFLLLGTVVYLFTTLGETYFIPTLTFLIGLWFACWWIGRTPLTASSGQRIAAWVGGPLVAVLVGIFAFIVLFQESNIPWQRFSPQALEESRAAGKTVMVDYTAAWCLTCKWNLKFAIETKAVRRLIEENRVVPMLADWTDHSPVIKKSLNDLGRNSIPTLAIWPAEPPGSEPIVLSDMLTESDVLNALKRAGPSRKK